MCMLFLINFQEARHFFTGCVVLKVIPKWLAKLLVSTGLINIIFKAYGKFGKLSLKDVLDSVTDDEELKATLAYIFGDYGKILSSEFFNFFYLFLCLNFVCLLKYKLYTMSLYKFCCNFFLKQKCLPCIKEILRFCYFL